MKALCGGWSLSGGPVSGLLPEKERAAIRAMAGGAAGRFEEIVAGPLWLAAAPGKLARRPSALAGMEGFLAEGPGSASTLESLLERFERDGGAEPRCAGHYVLAFADLERSRLSLLRDLSGCEKLYFTIVDGAAGKLLLFSSSVRPLLAHPAVPRAVNANTLLEFGLLGVTLFGDETPFAGIREVLPGHRLDVSSQGLSHRWAGGQSFDPIEGDPKTLGPKLWEGLLESVRGALGTDREAAVSLSGGIDSAVVTAALAEVLGPDHVHAFTYKFALSPYHDVEEQLARKVCGHLGIRRHTVARLDFAEHSKDLPEIVWHLESAWRDDTIDLGMARLAASHGFSKYFSGCSQGGDGGYLGEVADAWQAAPALMRAYWRRAVSRPWRRRWQATSALHPALDTLFYVRPFFFFPALCVLRHNGFVDSLSGFFPEPIGSMADEASLQPRIKEAVAATSGWPLAAQLRFHNYMHLNHQNETRGRPNRISRMGGARHILLYLFPRCFPMTQLPLRERLPFWDRRRRMFPGKMILREAVRDKLPAEVVFQSKLMVLNCHPDWLPSFARGLEPRLAGSLQSLSAMSGGRLDGFRRIGYQDWIDMAALWHALLIAKAPSPEWDGRY